MFGIFIKPFRKFLLTLHLRFIPTLLLNLISWNFLILDCNARRRLMHSQSLIKLYFYYVRFIFSFYYISTFSSGSSLHLIYLGKDIQQRGEIPNLKNVFKKQYIYLCMNQSIIPSINKLCPGWKFFYLIAPFLLSHDYSFLGRLAIQLQTNLNIISELNMKLLRVPILVLFCVIATHSSLQVYMPICAVNQVSGLVNYTLANFGHIPYGRTVIGEVIFTKNSQFCELDQTESFSTLQSEDVKKIVILKRGTCKFTKKIYNAQKKGADMVIVYDNQPSTTPNVVMSNDGHGHLINIPSIFISSFDGQKLLKTYQKCDKRMILKINFDVFTSKIANLTLWLDISNRESFITIRDFHRDYYNIIKDYINMDVKFKVNQNCGMDKCQSEDCVKNKNQFCFPIDKTLEGVRVQGKEYINEELRSYYLFESLKQRKEIHNWFNYMIRFDEVLCVEKLDMKDCSLSILKDYEKPEVIQARVVEAYTQINQDKPNILEKFIDDSYRSDILFYPEASINGRNFYGLFRAPDIFEMICQSLQKQPRQCHSFTKEGSTEKQGYDNTTGLWKTILLIIFFMVVLFFAILFVYNRLIKRELNQQMSMEVNKMVEHYVAMTEQKSKSNAAMEMN